MDILNNGGDCQVEPKALRRERVVAEFKRLVAVRLTC